MLTKIKGIIKIKNAWKDYDIVINQVKLENGDISGTFKGKLINMKKSEKITNKDIMISLEKINFKIEKMDSKIEKIDSKIEKMDSKINLIINCPTIQKEIDHEALSKLI